MENKNYTYKRWYDSKPYADGVLDILKQLSLQSHYASLSPEFLKVLLACKMKIFKI